jgi:rhodanese-related sulfurtransferase
VLPVLDIWESYEFDWIYIDVSHNVPRGVKESDYEWDYDETILELATARERYIIVVCHSGQRSLQAD